MANKGALVYFNGKWLSMQEAVARGLLKPKAKRKYRNIPTPDSEGRIHPSKLQAAVTDRLRAEGWKVIPEVSMPLSERAKDRIRIDALVIEPKPHYMGMGEPKAYLARFVEIKARDKKTGEIKDHAVSKQKRRRFSDRYGITIEVVTK